MIAHQKTSHLHVNGELLDAVKGASTPVVDSKYLQHGSSFQRLLTEAAYLPYCSWNKQAQQVRPKEYAIRYPYMQVNRPGMVSWLVFDLDHPNSNIWEDENLPEPNFIVANRDTGRSHLFYAIVPVCTTANARSKPIQYMKAIVEAMKIRLKADLSYSGPVAKTPGHPWWHTIERHYAEFELGDLAKYLELELSASWSFSKGPDLENNSHSRHELLFEVTRYYAYSIVNYERGSGSYQGFARRVHNYAISKNTYTRQGFSMNLSDAQITATVRSIARWTWDKYTGDGRCNVGVMQLDKTLSLKERQSLSATRTHVVVSNHSKDKITATCRMLLQKGNKLTQKAVSSASGLSRQTVAKYKDILLDIKTNSNIVELVPHTKRINNVNSGTHQITAGFKSVGLILDRVSSVVSLIDKQLELKLLDGYALGFIDPLKPP